MTDWGDPKLPEGDIPGYFLYQGGIQVPTYYVDQAAFAEGGPVSAAWTPLGVMRYVDGPLAQRVHALDREGPYAEDPVALEAEIMANPHLHAIVKANLVQNLRNIVG